MPNKDLFLRPDNRMGFEESMFNKVLWKPDRGRTVIEPFKFHKKPKIKVFDFGIDDWSRTEKQGNNYFNTLNPITEKLSDMYKSVTGNLPTSPYWEGSVQMETGSNYLRIENLTLNTSVDGHLHSHKVLQSLSYQDLGIMLLEFLLILRHFFSGHFFNFSS